METIFLNPTKFIYAFFVYICTSSCYAYLNAQTKTCYNGSLNTTDSVFFNVSTFLFTNVTDLSVAAKSLW